MGDLDSALAGLRLRNIGPAFMGGRIADIAVHPQQRSTWYVAVGSGGVWKTINAGTTFTPIFDDQPSYSIGCVTLDPQRPDTVWVGTGEAVSGRHVAWGTGVYRSRNGGASWEHMGLPQTEHIAKILVDPRDSYVIHVAAEGPLWSAGGQRGVFRSVDGGETWEATLTIDADTGVTSLAFAPDDPDTLYAASYQRRRSVAAFLGGGPGSGIHKSTDGGATWRRITQGLPEGDMGKIGLAVTAADPTIVYATVEADDADKGFYRSTDRGESWTKRNDYISGGTGPHYYQELFASPSNADRVYQVDVFLHWTPDGGATLKRLESGKTKHSDNHVVWIDPDDGNHLLVGCDAGLYETFDHGETFRHFPNLPISQFYRVAADNSEPFYNILGGAQDLGTLYGPARTTSVEGVRSQDWTVTLGADGYHVDFDPENPDVSYMEWQNGRMYRHDRTTMQVTAIRPFFDLDDAPERFNWDCPFFVSPHSNTRLYAASQRVWRSGDRGDTWEPISDDLTSGANRYELPTEVDGEWRTHSVDSLWDHMAMSNYATISHLTESPIADGVLYAGTDDGRIQVTTDNGATWTEAGPLPDVADGAVPFVNNVRASQHDAGGVFAVVDTHKDGVYEPLVYESTDHGTTWRSIAGDLPENTVVWCIQQDHVNPDLLFVGAETGVFVTVDRGEHWRRLDKKMPTIGVRDLVLHRRDNDLIAATFGRGFFILDDYSPLRTLSAAIDAEAPALLPIQDAWWYVPHELAQAPGQPTLGSSAYRAPNPEFGAIMTCWLPADVLSPKAARRKHEKDTAAAGDSVDFPSWSALWEEHVATDPCVELVITNADRDVVRRVNVSTDEGVHRVAWDLRLPPPDPPKLKQPEFVEPWEEPPLGPLVAPGTFTATLVRVDPDGSTSTLAGPESFEVRPVPALAGDPTLAEGAAFGHELWQLHRKVARAAVDLDRAREDTKKTRLDIVANPGASEAERTAHEEHHRNLEEQLRRLKGDAVRSRLSEPEPPSILESLLLLAERRALVTGAPTAHEQDELASLHQRFQAWSS